MAEADMIVASLRRKPERLLDKAVGEMLRGRAELPSELERRAKLVTALRENGLWPPSERYRV